MAERLYTTPLTCCLDGRAHDVTDENMAAGRKAGGRYQALCGHVVLPTALVAPTGRPCARCATVDVTNGSGAHARAGARRRP